MPAPSHNHLQSTTQDYLEINDVVNNLVILKDGTIAMVLTVNSLNFGLLSEEEQDAIIYTYASLLNSLSFPIQIVIRSQQKDISAYLQYLQDLEQTTLIPIRKTQIRRYREFVADLVKERNVLDKKFYIVIPYVDAAIAIKSSLPKIKKSSAPILDKPYLLEKAKIDLEPKRDHLASQFARIGLQARQLNTQELIHLMYSIYNPGGYDGQLVADTRSYTTTVVETSLAGIINQPSLQGFTKEGVDTGSKTMDNPQQIIQAPEIDPAVLPNQPTPPISVKPAPQPQPPQQHQGTEPPLSALFPQPTQTQQTPQSATPLNTNNNPQPLPTVFS